MEGREHLPPPARLVNARGASPYVLICEHASRFIPQPYNDLGLEEADLVRHIAWDIGAADVATALSAALDAPLVLASYSRLLIDLNRPVTSETSIPQVSETTVIPGNRNLSAEERNRRVATYFDPFQAEMRRLLDQRAEAGVATTVIGIHSFTPVYKGVARPWHAGILFRHSTTFGHALAEALGGAASHIAENEPYQIEDDSDYTVPVHGEARGLDAVLVEIRQDLIADATGQSRWAARLAKALNAVSAIPSGSAPRRSA